MMRCMETLLHDIDAFCRAHSIADSRFGLLAMNDKAFVSQLRGGREVLPSTERRVRTFMAEYRTAQQDAAA